MFRGNILFLLRIGNDCGHFRFVFSREGPLWQTAFAAPASCGSAALRGSNLALSVTACAVPPLPKGEALAKPYTLQFSRKLHRHAKGSPFGRAGALAPERARTLAEGAGKADRLWRKEFPYIIGITPALPVHTDAEKGSGGFSTGRKACGLCILHRKCAL